jgi:hypothetical protein
VDADDDQASIAVPLRARAHEKPACGAS